MRNIEAELLEAKASQARTLAEAQALTARADALRGHRKHIAGGVFAQLIRN